MKNVLCLPLVVALSAPTLAADLVVTRKKTREDRPGKEVVETMWIAKDRVRVEEGRTVVILRQDQKKLYMLDTNDKTFGTIELPFDIKDHVPPESRDLIDTLRSNTKAEVTPTTETQKVRDWNTTKYTLTMTVSMPGREALLSENLWVTKDIKIDSPQWKEMSATLVMLKMNGPDLTTELAKIDGLPVSIDRTLTSNGKAVKSHDEVTLVESKDAPEGNYEVPKDYTEIKPFYFGGSSPGKGRAKPEMQPLPVPPPKKPDGKDPPPRRSDVRQAPYFAAPLESARLILGTPKAVRNATELERQDSCG
jgi:hypothetical protein